MDGEQKFWIFVWVTLGSSIIGLAGVIATFWLFEGAMVERLIKAGADPIEASCAIRGIHDRSAAICALKAAKEK